MTDAEAKRRIKTRKYQGDDSHSWAVFLDGRPVYTGLGKPETAYYARLVRKIAERREPVAR